MGGWGRGGGGRKGRREMQIKGEEGGGEREMSGGFREGRERGMGKKGIGRRKEEKEREWEILERIGERERDMGRIGGRREREEG